MSNTFFSAFLEFKLQREINLCIRDRDGRGSFVVNPYTVPSKVTTIAKFFKQLKTTSHLQMFTDDVPDDRYKEGTKKRLYEFVAGPPNEEKTTILEDCLMEFRKLLIKDSVTIRQIDSVVGKDNKISMLKLHPSIVHVMYLQLFCEWHEHEVEYTFESFGIGKTENFLFDHFYCEDHRHIFFPWL